MNTQTRGMIALTAIAGLALTGCGASWPQADMEADLENELDSSHPEDAPHEVDCPGDLDVEEGQQMTCDLVDANGTGRVLVEVLSVDGNDFEYEGNVFDYELNDGAEDSDL